MPGPVKRLSESKHLELFLDSLGLSKVSRCYIQCVPGLTTSYAHDERHHDLMRMLMALPLLPAAHMEPAFRKLQQRHVNDSPAIADLLSYMEATWIAHPRWSPSTLSVYQQQVSDGWRVVHVPLLKLSERQLHVCSW